jgi:hypothetical protein
LVDQLPRIPDGVRSLYEYHQPRRTRPSEDILSTQLQSTASAFSKVFVVVDALDECSETIREELIAKIRRLPTNLQLMCTSRHLRSIEDYFVDSLQLEIRASDADIAAYIRAHIQCSKRLKRHVKGELALGEDIVNTIVDKARGMSVLT